VILLNQRRAVAQGSVASTRGLSSPNLSSFAPRKGVAFAERKLTFKRNQDITASQLSWIIF
jgi:hypothetical protein